MRAPWKCPNGWIEAGTLARQVAVAMWEVLRMLGCRKPCCATHLVSKGVRYSFRTSSPPTTVDPIFSILNEELFLSYYPRHMLFFNRVSRLSLDFPLF
jgi:hypothetical protein